MEDDGGFIPPNPPMFGNMDFDHDFINQLLDEGSWLQTAERLNLLQSAPSTARSSSFSSVHFPGLEVMPSSLTSVPQQGRSHTEGGRWNVSPGDPSSQGSTKEEQSEYLQCRNQISIVRAAKSPNQAQSISWEGDELNRILGESSLARRLNGRQMFVSSDRRSIRVSILHTSMMFEAPLPFQFLRKAAVIALVWLKSS